ncbi:MAG TPA: hypothetical protein VFG24_00100 [Nitrosopumilaceae archaeon]|nr:hypothetical protein [Nitrosopumilaceae archaeon]
MVAGAPRKHDREQIARDFIEWATDNPQALSVPMFAAPRGLHSEMMMNWAREDDEFRRSYYIGKELIGINRLKATMVNKENESNRLERGIYCQTLGNYDLDVREYQREEKRFEASLKNDDSQSVSKEHIESMEAILSLMKSRQSSARNIDDSNSNSEHKS